MQEWIQNNYQWFFSGLGVFLLTIVVSGLKWLIKKQILDRKQSLVIGGILTIILIFSLQFFMFETFWRQNVSIDRTGILTIISSSSTLAILTSYIIIRKRIKDLRDELIIVKGNSTFIDTLTGVLNTNALEHTLLESINTSKLDKEPMSLLLIDIDNFKLINDHNDRDTGDTILKSVVGILQGEIRSVHDRLIRYKIGDEFLVIAYRTSGINATKYFGERLRKEVESAKFQTLTQESKTISLTISIGVTEFNFEKDNSELALKRVERALNEAKKVKNHIVLK